MSFEKVVNIFLKKGDKRAVYRLTRDNIDGSQDNGIAYVMLGPHNLTHFRSYERKLVDGSKSVIEDVIIISKHKDGRAHWVWYNDDDESWVGEQLDDVKGIRVRGFGRVGRGHSQTHSQEIDFSVYRDGDVVYGETRDADDNKVLSKATYHPEGLDWEWLEGHGHRVAQHFGFRGCHEGLTQHIQIAVAVFAIYFAMQKQTKGIHCLFYWLVACYMMIGSVGDMRVKRWESALPMFGLGLVFVMMARSKRMI